MALQEAEDVCNTIRLVMYMNRCPKVEEEKQDSHPVWIFCIAISYICRVNLSALFLASSFGQH